MEPVILIIRQAGEPDVIDSFPDEDAARAALTRFVRGNPVRSGADHHSDDTQAIAA